MSGVMCLKKIKFPEKNCVRRRNAFAGDQVSGEEMWLEIKLQEEKCARRSNVSGA